MEVVDVLDPLIVNQCARIRHPLFTDLLLIFKVIEHLKRKLLVLLVHGVDRRPHCHGTTDMLQSHFLHGDTELTAPFQQTLDSCIECLVAPNTKRL